MENDKWYTEKMEVKRVEEGRIIISNVLLGSSGRRVKILEVSDNHREEVERQKLCFQTSLGLSSEFFLQGLVYFSEGERCVFIYQHYDKDISDVWAQDWSTFKLCLKQFLQALSRLYQEKNMCYGNIKHHNFVISEEGRPLVSGVEGNLLPDDIRAQDAIFTGEMKKLRRVILPSQNLGPTPTALEMFLDFTAGCELWNMIFCHPIFLDFQHKLYYFLIGNQYLNEHLGDSDLAKNLRRMIGDQLRAYGIYEKLAQ
ncbi:uncharacterized protein LOC107485120 [Arachis duranensis]|uniref:Uncharacterized protein LOC107485120 n=1 Tax=Arachis duranensis TaxID=130453 RepID=A0A9C6TEI3_ARADU|nr:uncharacterized protein LOC107485120 [Arachis duranensis]